MDLYIFRKLDRIGAPSSPQFGETELPIHLCGPMKFDLQ